MIMRFKTRPSRYAVIGFAGISLVLAAACSSSSSRSGGPQAGQGVGAVPVVVAAALQKDVPVEIRTIGTVEAYSTVSVKAQVTGEITGIYFKEGQEVKKGDVLFTIDSKPYEIALSQAEAILEKDRAQLKDAEADAQRYQGLVAKDYVTQEQYEKILANRDILRASIKADEANMANARLQLERCTVHSPIDGRTGSFLIDRGNLIRATDSSPALVINQIVPIRVSFSVPEQDLPRIKEYMAKGELKTEAVFPGGGPILGTLTFIDNSVDRLTGTITLKATFANQDRSLWPGEFVNVVLTLTTEKNAIVVPSQAIQTGQTGQYVFVVKDDMSVEMRPIKIDRAVGEETVVAEGVKPGEKIVTDGQLQLVPGARAQIKPSR
jgi:multidrug efflux system membrane fusion protein